VSRWLKHGVRRQRHHFDRWSSQWSLSPASGVLPETRNRPPIRGVSSYRCLQSRSGMTPSGEFAATPSWLASSEGPSYFESPAGVVSCRLRTATTGLQSGNLPLEDGIVFTGDESSSIDARSRQAGHSVAPLERMPPQTALRECLSLQSDAAPQSLFACLFGLDPLARAARRSYSGAIAELALADSLAALGREWTVLHSVPVAEEGFGDRPIIDHLVIGPAGIFTLSIQSHAGQSLWVGERTFIADGERLNHLAIAEEGALAVSRLLTEALAAGGAILDVIVTPCVVVDAPATLQVLQRPGRVQVVTARTFASWLTGLPRLKSPVAVEEFVAVAVSASTWPMSRPAHGEGEAGTRHRTAEFELLRHRVSSARVRRLLWTGLGVVVSYSALITNLGGLTMLDLTAALGG
jgi:hypothetical protein